MLPTIRRIAIIFISFTAMTEKHYKIRLKISVFLKGFEMSILMTRNIETKSKYLNMKYN